MGNNMKINNKILALLLLILSSGAYASENQTMILGDERKAYLPTEEDFNKMMRAREYLDSKLLFIEAQKNVQTALGGTASATGDSGNSFMRDGSVPREFRGKESGDRYLDSRGNQISVKKAPTTYVSNISGMSGNLSAELQWGENTLSIQKKALQKYKSYAIVDDLLATGGTVLSVNRDDIVIKSGDRRIRIGKLPIDINSIVSE